MDDLEDVNREEDQVPMEADENHLRHPPRQKKSCPSYLKALRKKNPRSRVINDLGMLFTAIRVMRTKSAIIWSSVLNPWV
jgi:hypothetical protein